MNIVAQVLRNSERGWCTIQQNEKIGERFRDFVRPRRIDKYRERRKLGHGVEQLCLQLILEYFSLPPKLFCAPIFNNFTLMEFLMVLQNFQELLIRTISLLIQKRISIVSGIIFVCMSRKNGMFIIFLSLSLYVFRILKLKSLKNLNFSYIYTFLSI